MKIKNRIALYFTLISTTMLFGVLCMIYFAFMKFLEADFFERLTDRTMVTAKLYLEADEISRDALNTVRQQYLQKLNGEVIRIYDEKDKATFIGDSTQFWTKNVIEKVRKTGKIKFLDGENQVVGIFYKDNQGDFVILASATDQGSHNRLAKLLKIMVGTFLAIVVVLLISARWIANKMLKPLQLFTADVEQLNAKNLAFRFKQPKNKDEINLLANSFNNLIAELEQAFILQKTFINNASHELRTPVTRLMMTTELALSKDRDTDHYQQKLKEILAETEKIDHIITALLALAKMDLEITSSQLSTVNLSSLLDKIMEDWRHKHDLELILNLQINEGSSVNVLANATLLQIALDNVIGNAFKFSNNQSVTCTLRQSDEFFILSIADNGTGISDDIKVEIFKPFYSRSKEKGLEGEGMGLYLTAKIIDLFKGHIKINTNQPNGTIFSIFLPKL
ncbi:sensor histidine kinase [Pedobacter namyangjuensis]|uniref:sensor histidine kinase n=1 Tax=Pedobacter namyangjuensis TaxID=600626 RepID=UPI000DE3C4A2|nr:HAMP domain-containing sensor histidine kinase [Pedobacter namyangjuensis]